VSLELRRLRVDLVLCYKIAKSLLDLKFDDFLCWIPTQSLVVTIINFAHQGVIQHVVDIVSLLELFPF
jgi:hypothetical protein